MRIARAVILVVAAVLPAHAADAPLSLAETLRLAVAESPNLAAKRALAESARISIGPAGALPDPKMKMAEENWPTTTEERWTRYEVMQMLRLGFSQEFPGGEKLALRTQRANEDLQQRVTTIDVQKAVVQREAAIAWITRYFADQAEARVADQIAEAELAVESGTAQYRAGRGTQAELVALQSAVVDLKNRRAEAALETKRARIALARFIGREADRPLGDTPDLSRLPEAVAGEVDADELRRSIGSVTRSRRCRRCEPGAGRLRPDWKVEVSYVLRGNQPFVQIPGLPPTFAGAPYPHNVSLEFTVDLPIFTRTPGPRLEAKLKELDAARALRSRATPAVGRGAGDDRRMGKRSPAGNADQGRADPADSSKARSVLAVSRRTGTLAAVLEAPGRSRRGCRW
jgi:hypothetical protein